MSYYVYPTKAAAEADLDRVNAAYIDTVVEVTGDRTAPPDARVTTHWAEAFECAEGFAFQAPPETLGVPLSGVVFNSVNYIEPMEEGV